MQVISAKELGQIIKLHRRMASLTQFQLAEILETDEKQLGKIERGMHYPSVPLFLKLIQILNIDISQFCPNNNIDTLDNKLTDLLRISSKKELELVYNFLNTIKCAV